MKEWQPYALALLVAFVLGVASKASSAEFMILYLVLVADFKATARATE